MKSRVCLDGNSTVSRAAWQEASRPLLVKSEDIHGHLAKENIAEILSIDYYSLLDKEQLCTSKAFDSH